LKQRERGIADVDLDSGAAYFVNEEKYRADMKRDEVVDDVSEWISQ
jgi:hypothetical protein